MPKLYKFEATLDVVVWVDDDEMPNDRELLKAAQKEVANNSTDIMSVESMDELSGIRDLPPLWEGCCLPWFFKNGRLSKDPKERDISDFFTEEEEKSTNNDT